MVKLIPFPDPMPVHRFETIVRERAKFSHMVVQTDHLKQRMDERDVSFRQVLNVLRKGNINGIPTWNPPKASYEGKMKYHGTGREVSVHCAIRESNLYVFAVTVY